MPRNDTDHIDVEQYAGDDIRLQTSITRIISGVDIVVGKVSGSGKTISVELGDNESFRLDTAEIIAGNTEFRESRKFELYTREGFRHLQRMNKQSGPRRGVNEVTDAEKLPEVTHQPKEPVTA